MSHASTTFRALALGALALATTTRGASAQTCTAANAQPFTSVNVAAIRAGSSITLPAPGATTISATLFIPASTCVQASFTSYKLPGAGFTLDPYEQQVKADGSTAYYGPGTYALSANLPTQGGGSCDASPSCIQVRLVGSTVNTANGQTTFTFSVTSTCRHAVSYVAFELTSPVKAVTPNGTYQGTWNSFSVENTTKNPFYSIKFNTNGEGIKAGKTETFAFTLPAGKALPNPMRIQVKSGLDLVQATWNGSAFAYAEGSFKGGALTPLPTPSSADCAIAPWQADLYFGPEQYPLSSSGHQSNTLIWLASQVRANDGGLQNATGRMGPSVNAADLPVLTAGAATLGRNYPNPFVGRTTIPVVLAERGDVRLEVFDALGRRMATVHEGALEAGTHALGFDGSALTPGVYLYRLTTAGGTRAGQMTVAR